MGLNEGEILVKFMKIKILYCYYSCGKQQFFICYKQLIPERVRVYDELLFT